jgi:uncharacterized protein YjbJ (UPF0337 family)
MPRKTKQPPDAIPGETLDKIILLVVSLQSKGAVKAACIEKMGLTADQADGAIETARGKIRDAIDTDRRERTGEAIVRLNDLYERSLRVQDCKTALAAQKELNRLLDLRGKAKAPPGDTSKPAPSALRGLKVIGSR